MGRDDQTGILRLISGGTAGEEELAMIILPDGSSFFVGKIGPRERGFINFMKYARPGYARPWLFLYRMFRTARQEIKPKPNLWKAWTYAWMVRPRWF